MDMKRNANYQPIRLLKQDSITARGIERGDCIQVGGGDLLKEGGGLLQEGGNNVCCSVSPPSTPERKTLWYKLYSSCILFFALFL